MSIDEVEVANTLVDESVFCPPPRLDVESVEELPRYPVPYGVVTYEELEIGYMIAVLDGIGYVPPPEAEDVETIVELAVGYVKFPETD